MFLVQVLSQNDPRWKNNLLGTDRSSTIGRFGCLLTCLAMVANGFGADETPASLNDKMKAAGGFQDDLIIPAVLPRVVQNLRYKGLQVYKDSPAPLDQIDAALNAGKPVVVEVDFSPVAGLQNHWVVLVDKTGVDYLIADPYPFPLGAGPLPLSQHYGFAGDPAHIIKSALWMDSTETQPPITVVIPKDGFAVYAAVDGLALRSQPLISPDDLVTRLALNEKLFAAGEAAEAQAKIGQAGQWLQVIETTRGYLGYVAAWLVGAQPLLKVNLGAPPEPPPPSALVVYSMAEGLSLRSQPVIADATLLKHEPLNAPLTVTEGADQAGEKIGMTGQWLQVKDIQGDQGWVAAWYVSRYPQSALGVVPKTGDGAPPAHLVVRSTQDLLALRSHPLISDATLIRRYPAQSEFLVQEPPDQALAKIGQLDQWLNVSAVDGQVGYVAAWYVAVRPESAT